MSDTIRSFIAIELPAVVLARIRSLQDDLKSFGLNVRWVRSSNMHLTLKFLGNIRQSDVENIRRGLSAVVGRHSALTLCAKGVGVFPGIKRPRVIWVGIGGQVQMLAELQESIEDGLAAIGFTRENRRFKAHLTLGRFKGPVDVHKLCDAIGALNTFASDVFNIDQLFLFKSDLKPSGPEYTKLGVLPLAG